MGAYRTALNRELLAARMNKTYIAVGLLVLASLASGCRQPTTPGAAMAPMAPFGANTRVPPPATGSYSVPDGYYRGQASSVPAGYSGVSQVASAASETGQRLSEEANRLRREGQPLLANELARDVQPTWASVSPRYDQAVSQASYQADPVVSSGSYTAGPNAGGPSTVAPSGAYAAGTGSELRPQLDGMKVVDLSRYAAPTVPQSTLGRVGTNAGMPVHSGAPAGSSVPSRAMSSGAMTSGNVATSSGASWGSAVPAANFDGPVTQYGGATGVTESAAAPGIPVQTAGGHGGEELQWRPPFR